MPQGVPNTEIRAKIAVSLDRELLARVISYHKAVDPGRPASDTIRELLYLGLNAGDPTKGVLVATRKLGANRAMAFIWSRMSVEMNRLRKELDAQAQEIDANVLVEAELAVRNSRR